jgi:glutamate synthase domain-containing protein 1
MQAEEKTTFTHSVCGVAVVAEKHRKRSRMVDVA